MSHGVDCFQIGNDDSVIGGIRVVGVDVIRGQEPRMKGYFTGVIWI